MTLEDINQLKAELEKKDQKISDLIAERKAFIRVVSHDLRSPISRIIGFADLLEKDLEDNEELKEFATMIVGAGWQLSEMITRIKEVEEFDSDEEERAQVDIDLSNSIPSLAEDSRDLFEKKNIELKVEVPDQGFLYHTNKQDFDLVVTNLLTNAAKFSPKGAKVVVSLQLGDTPQLVISDEGPGFHPDELNLTFQKFSKLSAKPTAGETATGLGLYVVKKCLNRMGNSSITIDTEHGKGTNMIVKFS